MAAEYACLLILTTNEVFMVNAASLFVDRQETERESRNWTQVSRVYGVGLPNVPDRLDTSFSPNVGESHYEVYLGKGLISKRLLC